jgi:hypothetical protein
VRIAVLDPEIAAASDEVELLALGRVPDAVAGDDGPAPVVRSFGIRDHLRVHRGAKAALVGAAGDGARGDGAVDGLRRVGSAGTRGSEVEDAVLGLKLELERIAVGSHSGGAGDAVSRSLRWVGVLLRKRQEDGGELHCDC